MRARTSTRLHVVYILPSRYDDDGYVHRYWRGVLPSNTLACLKSLTLAVARSGELGADADLRVTAYDESVQRIPVGRIIRRARRAGERLLIGLVGVQSNQFPRAADLAVQFRAAGVPVMIGGFHVSGVLAMFAEPTPELRALLDIGVTLVRGEAEAPGAMAQILLDALNDRLQPIYAINDPPDLTHAAVPQPDPEYLRHFVWRDMGTIDTSRGCPFNCSFCTIINVQGRKMRHRSVEAIVDSIRANYERGVRTYFFTDDNLSRSPVWEPLFDELARMRAAGLAVRFMMQIDTQAWKIPRFLQKAKAAGCYLVFIGMESVNPDNLAAAGKRQNKVREFAQMTAAWHDAGILVEVGYIIGFPHDTVDSVRADLAFLKDEVRVDEAAFFMLTPLPGSRDHRRMIEQCTPMDADLNRFDSFHETFRHPRLKPGDWQKLYEAAWQTFYSTEHMLHLLLRTPRHSYWVLFWALMWNRYSILLKSHPMVTGLIRLKARRDRRPCFPRESVIAYLWRRARDWAHLARVLGRVFLEFEQLWLLSHRPDDPRWAILAELHAKWAALQRYLAQCDLGVPCSDALVSLREYMETASARLRQLGGEGVTTSRRLRRWLRRKADEIDAYVQTLDPASASRRLVVQSAQYARENLLERYEEVAIRYVAQRRRFNAYWAEVRRSIGSWRILTLDVAPIPRALLFEIVMALRFTAAFCSRAM